MNEIESVIRQKSMSGEIALPLDLGEGGGEEVPAGNEEEA
jgi:hypothetical protein